MWTKQCCSKNQLGYVTVYCCWGKFANWTFCQKGISWIRSGAKCVVLTNWKYFCQKGLSGSLDSLCVASTWTPAWLSRELQVLATQREVECCSFTCPAHIVFKPSATVHWHTWTFKTRRQITPLAAHRPANCDVVLHFAHKSKSQEPLYFSIRTVHTVCNWHTDLSPHTSWVPYVPPAVGQLSDTVVDGHAAPPLTQVLLCHLHPAQRSHWKWLKGTQHTHHTRFAHFVSYDILNSLK